MSINTSSSINARDGNLAWVDAPKTIKQESLISTSYLNKGESSKVFTFKNTINTAKVSIKEKAKVWEDTQKYIKAPIIKTETAAKVKTTVKAETAIKEVISTEYTPKIISDESKLVLNAAKEEVISDEAWIIEKKTVAVKIETKNIALPQKPLTWYDIPETANIAALPSISQKAEYISQTISDADLEKLFHKNQARFKNTSDKIYTYSQFLSAWEAYNKALLEDGEEKTLVLKKHFIESYFYLKWVEEKNYKEMVRKSKAQKKTSIKTNPQKRK